jgi:5-methylcytosine-specific restriction protein A
MVAALRKRLEQRVAGAAKLSWTGTITGNYAWMIVCDSSLRPILRDKTGLPIDMGRSRRTAPVDLRRYLTLRDRGCAFPGCRRPPSWCESHHLVLWSRNGTTDRHNMMLLCVHHHTLIHLGAWDVRMDEFEVPWFIPSAAVDPYRTPIPANGRMPRKPRTPSPTVA